MARSSKRTPPEVWGKLKLGKGTTSVVPQSSQNTYGFSH